MEVNTTSISIVFFIIGVIQIILIIKIWQMTNDVKTIKEKLDVGVYKRDLIKSIVKGNTGHAIDLLTDAMIDDIDLFVNGKAFSSIEEIKKKYEPKFKKLGTEIPSKLIEINSASDYSKMI